MNVAGDDWRDYTPLAHHLTFGDWILREIFIHHPVHLFSWKPRSLLKTATVTPHHKVAPPWRTRRASPVHMGTLQWSFPKNPGRTGYRCFFVEIYRAGTPKQVGFRFNFLPQLRGILHAQPLVFGSVLQP